MRRVSQGLFRSLFGSLSSSWVVFGVVVGLLAAGGRAWAQAEPPEAGFSDKGHFALSAERMFGYVHTSEDDGGTKTTFNSISLLGSPIANIASIYTFPRVGFDGFVAPSVSLGGSLTYFHLSSSGSGSGTVSGFLVAPRVGFAGRLAPTVWIWPRAGVTYVNFSTSPTGGSQSSHLFAATVEVPVVVALAPQALLLIGPTLDLGLSGSTTISGSALGGTDLTRDIKETDIGFQVGFALGF
jgi:hypothetical protein